MVNFELREAVLSEKEKKELETARTLPITYDEDSPELDETMEQAFRQARRKKPYSGKPLTVYVSPKTMEKAKSLGDDYEAVLGRLLDKAVDCLLYTSPSPRA